MIAIGTFIAIAYLVLAYILNGIALKLLWGWFLVPILGLPMISVTQAIGIGIAIGFLVQQHIPRDKEQKTEQLIYTIISPILAIAVGWIVHLFM